MHYLIEDFIEATNSALSPDEAFLIYQKAVTGFGFESAVYTFITDHPRANQKAGHGVKYSYPLDWMEHYWRNRYDKIDPIPMHALRNNEAFAWEDLLKTVSLTKRQSQFMNEAIDAGLNSGVGVPLHGACGEIAGVGLATASKTKLILTPNHLSKLKLLTEQFHLTYCALSSKDFCPDAEYNLTRRETEILKWWANGKTADEIAGILGCTRSNVKFHVQNIYVKLNANTKILAVTKAIRLGLIPLDSVKVV